MIVVEGVDNSGKSTLIRSLMVVLPDWAVQVSEGPPKHAGEMDTRVTRYFERSAQVVYDRHPCVSQPIYGTMRSHLDPIDPRLLKEFYERKPFFVYCDPGDRGLDGHTHHEGVDTERHLQSLTAGYDKLLEEYRKWAIDHAHIVYRIGDNIAQLQMMVEALVGRRR